MSDASNPPNKLIHTSSPYLKQHAYNPVWWYPWGKEALQRAKDEDRPMIISIGYSACHWCHVMERESFENEEIARVMNDVFVCIKVDREERPDVDQIYMEAIQTMGLQGGWPLNVFAMPDQKPFYGGTYFPPKKWLHILNSISQAFREKRNQLEVSAVEFTKALSVSDSEKYGLLDDGFSANSESLNQMVSSMMDHCDWKEGGLNRAPKFPNPSIWKFLLNANGIAQDKDIHKQIMLTLIKMASGGIYDQIGGGFARYSVDEGWFAPHFEKMLYDNGQLISLYSVAYQVEKDERFKEVVYESIEFVKSELMSSENGFYSALDADSEEEEGSFYIWTADELEQILGKDAAIIMKYYQVEGEGNWERGSNILHTKQTPEDFAAELGIVENEFQVTLKAAKSRLMAVREKREKPGLDDKILTSWNALMLKGLIDAYHSFGEESFLDLAQKNASFIYENLCIDGALLRNYSSESNGISAYLDDYAFAIDAFLSLYQATFKRQWLDVATELTDYAMEHFYDSTEELFYFTDYKSEQLIARKKEIFDNVIPSSNSAMAQNLYFLGHLLERDVYLKRSENMISKIAPLIKTDPQYLTNWGSLYAFRTKPIIEIAIIGEDFLSFSHELQKHFIPNMVICGSAKSNDLPLLQNRISIHDKTTIYVCFNKSCKLPVHSIDEALEQIKGVDFL